MAKSPLAQRLRASDKLADRAIVAFYAARDDRAFWTRSDGGDANALSRNGEALMAQLREAEMRGLNALFYLPAARAGGDPLRLDAAARAETELALSRLYLRFAADIAHGRIDPQTTSAWQIPRRGFDPHQALALLQDHGVDQALETLEPQREDYQRLLAARRVLVERVETGGWPGVSYEGLIRPGDRHDAIVQLRARLRAGGELDRDGDAEGDPRLYDDTLVAAVETFQRYHGIDEDGVLGPDMLAALNVSAEQRLEQLDRNLERLRWLPDDPDGRHVVVNLAAFQLQAFDGTDAVLDMPVIIGKAQHATPAFADEIEYLQLNPYWHVPNSIVVNEIAPKMLENPQHLAAQDMEILSAEAADSVGIDPADIDWSRYAGADVDFPHRLRQRPGSKNALGRIKFMFPNEHAIYLHDTPAGHLFDKAQRTFSHGCIRVSDPLALAEFLLADTPDWDGARVRSAIDAGDRDRITLAEHVPVRLIYVTAWADGDDARVHFREDVYDRDRELADRLRVAAESEV